MSNVRFALDLFFHELNHNQKNPSPNDEDHDDISFLATKKSMDEFFSSIVVQDVTSFYSAKPCAVNTVKSEPLNIALQIKNPIKRNIIWLQESEESPQKRGKGRPKDTFFERYNSLSTSELMILKENDKMNNRR